MPPEDEAHRFLFHVRGDAGVGKTTLLRQLEQTAREHRALVALVDESVHSVPEMMAAISAQCARQATRCGRSTSGSPPTGSAATRRSR
ncbi:hypothetical protein NKH77_31485 [Streptomyces sp. M19]